MSTLTRVTLGSKKPEKGPLDFHPQNGKPVPVEKRTHILSKELVADKKKTAPVTANPNTIPGGRI